METPPRPPSFDARVMAYVPGLRRLAYKLHYRGQDADDLVTDTIIIALSRWKAYREDGGFWMWLQWQMRGIVGARRQLKKVQIVNIDDFVDGSRGEFAWRGNQEDYADLSAALSRISGKSGEVLLRRVMGDGLREIAEEMQVSKEWVRQLEERARADLKKAVG